MFIPSSVAAAAGNAATVRDAASASRSSCLAIRSPIICVRQRFRCRLARHRAGMEIHHLKEFAAIAETGSFSKAARKLRIAQPPLSRHIQQLENELGIKLFIRSASGVQITREGSLLLSQARAVLDDASALMDLAARARAGRAGTLRVAMAPGLCEVVNRIRIHLVKTVPQLAIEGSDMSPAQQYAALRRRLVDVGLLRHVPEDAEIDAAPLFKERFVVLVSEAHPLAKKRTLKL